jgi:shikimate dehydrogenase
MHNAAFTALDLDWVYVAFAVARGGAAAAVAASRAFGLAGLNVTMPHKAEAAAAVDHLTPVASKLGAVNTVFLEGSHLVGDSTDGAGFLDAVRGDEGFEPAGRRCLILGAGGAARAVVLALASAGVAEVIVAARRSDAAEAAAALAGSRGRVGTPDDADGVELVVNATPVGMAIGDASPIPSSRLGPGQLVVDLIYHPPVTALLVEARQRGAIGANGLGMLLHQAAHAFRAWTGEEPPLAVMSAAVVAELAHRQPTQAAADAPTPLSGRLTSD